MSAIPRQGKVPASIHHCGRGKDAVHIHHPLTPDGEYVPAKKSCISRSECSQSIQ